MNANVPMSDEQFSHMTQVFLQECFRRVSANAVCQLLQSMTANPIANAISALTNASQAPQPVVPPSEPVPSAKPVKKQAKASGRQAKKNGKYLKGDMKEEVKDTMCAVIKESPMIAKKDIENEIRIRFREIGQSQMDKLLSELRDQQRIIGQGRPKLYSMMPSPAA